MSPGIGWSILALVFLDELAAMAAFGVWGWQHDPRVLWVWLLPLLAMTAWGLFASPKARFGGPVVRPVAKVVVFGLATLALFDAGYPGAAWALLGFSVLINALALLPGVHELAATDAR